MSGDNDECETIAPLDDLQSLLDWASLPNIAFQTKPLARKIRNNEGVTRKPKTLVCHDMAGGYHDDRFVNGTTDCDEYIFSYWDMVDIFVYFSHHFITIPPICWTNAAHLHGVPVLGTIITEFSSGSELWQKFFLLSEDEENLLLEKLCLIMIHYGFDGWLFNVENPIDRQNIPRLIEFVGKLRRSTKEIRGDSGWVIWYDSVTENGELKWQNALTAENRCFFDVSDGIFLNYTWQPEKHLDGSISMAGQRKTDVFVGVDVFGRGCYGGGGWNSHLAVREAWKRGLSVAIFAQGWVYEKFTRMNLLENQKRFWQRIKAERSQYALDTEPEKKCRLVFGLPFSTGFDHGRGKFRWIHGRKSGESYGFRMSQQEIQAVIPDSARVGNCRNWVDNIFCDCLTPLPSNEPDVSIQLDIDEEDSFLGGSSQVLTWSGPINDWQPVVFLPHLWKHEMSNDDKMELHVIFISKRYSQERREGASIFDFIMTLVMDESTLVTFVPSRELDGRNLSVNAHRAQVFNDVEEAKERLRDFHVYLNEEDVVEIEADGTVKVNGWEMRTHVLRTFNDISCRDLGIEPIMRSDNHERAAWLKLGYFAMRVVEKKEKVNDK